MLLLDKIIISLLIIFFILGWFKGVLKALIGPLSFLLSLVFAILFYDLNKNIVVAGLIVVFGTLGLSTCLTILLTISLATVNTEVRGKVFLLSRILGSILNVLWQGNLILLTLVIIAVLPTSGPKMQSLQTQILHSPVVRYYYQHVIEKHPHFEASITTLATFQDPVKFQLLATTKEYKTFRSDPRVEEFMNNPKIIKANETKNLFRIAISPAFAKLIANDIAMESFTVLTEKMYVQNLEALKFIKKPVPPANPSN